MRKRAFLFCLASPLFLTGTSLRADNQYVTWRGSPSFPYRGGSYCDDYAYGNTARVTCTELSNLHWVSAVVTAADCSEPALLEAHSQAAPYQIVATALGSFLYLSISSTAWRTPSGEGDETGPISVPC
jgi:hypothetical protein